MAIITRDATTRASYAWLSGLLFVAMIASVPIARVLLVDTPPVAQAIGILIVPFSVFCWIFSTIRALHLRDLRYWSLASTYVNVAISLIAVILVLIAAAVTGDGKTAPKLPIEQNPVAIACALFYFASLLWSLFYNARKTGSFILAFNLTLMQTSLAFAAVVLFFLRWDSQNAERVNNERNGIYED